MQKSPVVVRAIVVEDHKTSVSLEDEFWKGLKEIAALRRTNVTGLVSKIGSQRKHRNLSSACRIFVLNFYRNQVPNTEGGEGLHEEITRPAQMHSWRD